MIPSFLRPFLAALLMVPILSLAGWIAAHGGPTIPNEQLHQIVDYTLEIAIPVMAGLAVIVRRLVDKKVNPDNAASTHAAAAGKAKQQARKETRKLEARLNEAGLKSKNEPPSPIPPNSPDLPERYFGE